MKKSILAFVGFVFLPLVSFEKGVSNEKVVSKKPEKTKVVSFSITMYCDDETDKAEWAKVVEQAEEIMQIAREEGRNNEFITGIVNSIGAIPDRNRTKGIHGEIRIGIGDGTCDCKPACNCGDQYKGLCLCVLKADGSQ